MVDISDDLQINHETSNFPLRHWELVWFSLILFAGALGNLLVCLVIYKSSSLFRSTPFNMYLCSLAVADLLLALVVLPHYVLSTPVFKHPSGVWGDVMCKTITGDFLTFYFSAASEYSLILISLERLRAVHKPIINNVFARSSSKRRAWLSIIAAWFIPFVYQSPKAFYILEYKRSRIPTVGNYCTFAWGRETILLAKIYGGIILAFEGIIPLTIFIYSFYNIQKCLLKEERRVSGRIRRDRPAYDNGYKDYNAFHIVERRQKTVRILMIVTIVFIICWIPDRIMFFMINYLGEKYGKAKLTWNSPIYQIGILIGYTGSCINPCLFALQSREFRKHSKKTLKSFVPKCLIDNNDDFQYRQFGNAIHSRREGNIAASTKADKQVNKAHTTQVNQADTNDTMGIQNKAKTSGVQGRPESSRSGTCMPKINIVI